MAYSADDKLMTLFLFLPENKIQTICMKCQKLFQLNFLPSILSINFIVINHLMWRCLDVRVGTNPFFIVCLTAVSCIKYRPDTTNSHTMIPTLQVLALPKLLSSNCKTASTNFRKSSIWPGWDEPTTSQYENRHSTNRATGWENNTVYCFHPKYWDRHGWANSVDPDQTAPKGQFDLGLHYLPFKELFSIQDNLIISYLITTFFVQYVYIVTVNQQWWVWSKKHVHRLIWAIHYENMPIQIY